ncbi:MAG: DNA topoisomerase IB [Solirubrobacteraceae bacterium]
MPRRLRKSDCSIPGIARRRRGRGFRYVDPAGEPVDDPETIERIEELSIPPAWKDVWICMDPLGHLQATGIDAAGRKQYLYHERWRTHRDRRKFAAMVDFGHALPRLRRRVNRDLARSDLERERVLACAVRMLDLGFFRIGSEDYAERNESYGLATRHTRHVSLSDGCLVFDYPAKSGQRRVQAIADEQVRDIVAALKRRHGGGEELLAYRNGRGWVDVRSEDINAYLKQAAGEEFSAKDFRTWNATVLAAVTLGLYAVEPRRRSSRERAIREAVKGVAAHLGNTPAVCRASYIDPRVIDRYRAGVTIASTLRSCAANGGPDLANMRVRRRVESAVLDLLVG